MKKYLYYLIFLGAIFTAFFFSVSNAQELPELYLFHSTYCVHCQAEISFLSDLKKDYPGLKINEYEVSENAENAAIFIKKWNELGIKTSPSVPLTVIGEEYLIGFDNPENSGEKIKEMLGLKNEKPSGNLVKVPLIGEINIEKYSLPVLAAVLGSLDGFNPCSMWALIVLITLVLTSGSRKKVFLVGGVFILTSFISYFLFMAAWFNAFILLDYYFITRIIVGIVAIGAGIFSIREFFTFKPNTCEVSSPEQQKKTEDKITKVLRSASLPALIAGVAGIAFSVNLVELVCSLGLPVVFTKALSMRQMSGLGYYLYILAYDFFYMLDDIIVVAIAGYSMKFFGVNSRYSRWSRIVGGVIMIALGLIFALKPDLLSLK